MTGIVNSKKIKLYCVKRSSTSPPPVRSDFSFGQHTDPEHLCQIFEFAVNVGNTRNTGKKIIGLTSCGFFEKIKGFGAFQSDTSSTSGFCNALFYLTFNTYDGKKNVESVEDAKEIESIVLEYKVDCVETELNHNIMNRKKEIESLKMERKMLCELIDRISIANDSVCDTIREQYTRFFDLKTAKEMNDEFDFINKQIQIGHEDIYRYEKQLEESKTKKYESISMTIPCGVMVTIKLGNNFLGIPKMSNCYWEYANVEDHVMYMKENELMFEVDDNEIKKRRRIEVDNLA